MAQTLIFFGQPVLWIALIRMILVSNRRIKMTRQKFGNAIYPGHFEVHHFWLNLLIYGIMLSAVGLLVGPIVSFNWLLIYECLVGLNLILLPRWILPITTAGLASIIAIAIQDGWLPQLFHQSAVIASPNYLLIVSIVLVAVGLLVEKDGGSFKVPQLYRNQRNVRSAKYQYNELTIAPMFLLIPGDLIHQLMNFWPVFNIGGHSFGIFLAPLLLGLKLTAFKNDPRKLFRSVGIRFIKNGFVGLSLVVIAFGLHYCHLIDYNSGMDIGILVILLYLILATVVNLYQYKRYDDQHGDAYAEAVDGVRIIGIVPNTPAAKMNLAIGDVILDANEQPVTNEDQFYDALLKQPTYCHLRVRDHHGELKLTDTAIYNNSPHEIGIILFKKSSLN